MKRLFRATAVSILSILSILLTLIIAACADRGGDIVAPVPVPAANHVPGQPPTVHSVGVLVNGNVASVIWHVDPFNMGEGYTVEVFKGTTCAGTNLVPGGSKVAGLPWTQPLHLYLNLGPLAPGAHCARVKSNGLFSPQSFQAFITVTFVIGSPNSPPAAGFSAPADALEGTSVTFTGVAEDPDGDPLAFEWAIDGTRVSSDSAFSHAFPDNGQYLVTFTVADGKGGTAEAARTIEVGNVQPSLAPATGGTGAAVPVGLPVDVAGLFEDPGTLDTHSLALDCNAGGSSLPGEKAVAVRPDYSGRCAWAAAGAYTVRAAISDDDGGTDSRDVGRYVVYAPGVGHVTGGGWIDSPADACQLTPACAGQAARASFGFTSRYVKSKGTPTGSVTFQLGSATLVFRSTSQAWLSVAGQTARIGGVGRVNGEGEFDFLLTAVDGGAADSFRIWIRDRTSGDVIYDSRPGLDPLAGVATGLAGGGILIHAGS
jgi:PKD repeat protein